jgi:signal peptidase II
MSRFFWIPVVVIAVDQITKLLAQEMLAGSPIDILPVFSLTLTYNTGAAFGFLNDAGGWQNLFFIAVAVVVSGVIIAMVRKLSDDELQTAVALLLILGGALGNVVDRVRLGRVVDFLHVYYGNWSFPIFNIADSAITVGAILLALDVFGVRLIGAKQKSEPHSG